ncbi:MAG: fibronectin type III domain-containing protein [Candidatus Acidiferrales bacterium]
MPPTVKIPEAPTELTARQAGERVLLRWTLPRLHTDGTRLDGPPKMEVLRAFVADAVPDEDTFSTQAKVAYALPPQVVKSFLHTDIVAFPDVLGPSLLREQAGRTAVYAVRAVNEKGQSVGLSNLVGVRVYPVPAPVAVIATRVTERAIELRWDAPTRTTSGTSVETIAGYQVYRSETGAPGSFALHGTAGTTHYEDTRFQFAQKYFYAVRTLAQYGADTVESESSVAVEVAAKDLFPPPAPANLIVVAGAARIDLTWDASAAPDLAGYFVYRSEQPAGTDTRLNVVHQRLNAQPLRVQSYADTTIRAGVRYYYAVTAVDAEGNESAFSEEVSATPLAPE